MRKIIIGILIGILLCVSFFELIHRTVEVDGSRMCGMIYDKLLKQWHPGFVYQLKVIYKFFALPIKTTWICISEEGIATSDGFGRDSCDGEWKFQKLGFND